tara:strand:+ start:2887 stop:3852 length:966 start_codon:yes stop_codon:yes gene_type:complete
LTRSLKKTLKIALPILLGVFLVWYAYYNTSSEDRKQIAHYIKQADIVWVGLSMVIGILSHISRAVRWNLLLKPLGYTPRLSSNVLIILMSYFANILILRSGEILRATALTTYENVPFEKGFGTIVTERIIDLIMLLLIVITALFLQTEVILGFLQEKGINYTLLFAAAAVGLLILVVFAAIIKRSTSKIAIKIRSFVNGLLEGVLSIFKMKNKWLFIFHTVFIWTCYIGMLWVIKYTVLETVDLTLSQILVVFVPGAFAMTAINGGLGIYPIAISKALGIFGISPVSGDAYGWIMWISQTLLVVVFGAISFLVLPLLKRNK